MMKARWQRINTWRIKGPILAVAFLLGIFDHVLHLGGVSFAAAIAIVVPAIGFRASWREWRFWASLAAVALLQIPLVLALRPLVDKSGFATLFIFGMLDCGFVLTAIFYVLEGDLL